MRGDLGMVEDAVNVWITRGRIAAMVDSSHAVAEAQSDGLDSKNLHGRELC